MLLPLPPLEIKNLASSQQPDKHSDAEGRLESQFMFILNTLFHLGMIYSNVHTHRACHLQLSSSQTQGADICFLMMDNYAQSSAIISSRC